MKLNPRYTVKISGRDFLVSLHNTLKPVMTIEETARLRKFKLLFKESRTISKKRARYLQKRGDKVIFNAENKTWQWMPGLPLEYQFICPDCGCCMFNTTSYYENGYSGEEHGKRGHCKGGSFNNDNIDTCLFAWDRKDDAEVFRYVRRWTPRQTLTDKKSHHKVTNYGAFFTEVKGVAA